MKNITLAEYYTLENKSEYDFILKYVMPKDVYSVGDFTNLPFGIIKEIQQDMADGISWSSMIEYISKVTKKRDSALGKHLFLDIARFISYIRSEIDRINSIEKDLLAYNPTTDEKSSGIEGFNKFGNYAQLRMLANGDITKIKEIEKMKYTECLLELCYQKELADYQERLFEVKRKKH